MHYYNKSGIYKIVNKVNGKVYIGSSISIQDRWLNHTSSLNLNKHPNSHLQRAYNKYGADNMSFEVIELIPEEQLAQREGYWIESLCSYNRQYGYNIARIVEGRVKATEETRKKMTAAQIERWNKVVDRKQSDEHIAKLSKARKGRIINDEWKSNISNSLIGNTYCLGFKHTDETKANLSAERRERWSDPEFKAKMSAIQKKSQNKPETKLNHNDMLKERWSDPEYKAKMSAILKHTHNQPDVKAKLSDGLKERWSDPEYKAKMSAALKLSASAPDAKAKRSAAAKSAWAKRKGLL